MGWPGALPVTEKPAQSSYRAVLNTFCTVPPAPNFGSSMSLQGGNGVKVLNNPVLCMIASPLGILNGPTEQSGRKGPHGLFQTEWYSSWEFWERSKWGFLSPLKSCHPLGWLLWTPASGWHAPGPLVPKPCIS